MDLDGPTDLYKCYEKLGYKKLVTGPTIAVTLQPAAVAVPLGPAQVAQLPAGNVSSTPSQSLSTLKRRTVQT